MAKLKTFHDDEERDRVCCFHLKKMTNKNQSFGVGQDSMPSMTCLIHILEAWFGVEHLEDYWNFANYLLWVFTPLLLLILPYFFLLYLTIIFLHIYKRKNVLKEAYSHNLWDGARKTVATLWDGHAAVWHGKQLALCSELLLVWVHWHPSLALWLIEEMLKNMMQGRVIVFCYLFACVVHMYVFIKVIFF